jgi:hypothetical protein
MWFAFAIDMGNDTLIVGAPLFDGIQTSQAAYWYSSGMEHREAASGPMRKVQPSTTFSRDRA